MNQQPRLLYSPLGRRVYVVTRYKVKVGAGASGKDVLVATQKWDVTEDYKELRRQRVRVS